MVKHFLIWSINGTFIERVKNFAHVGLLKRPLIYCTPHGVKSFEDNLIETICKER